MPHWLTHWFQFNYAPPGQPFYQGATWGNVFVILVVAPLGWLWSRTKFWPIRPVRRALDSLHAKVDEHRQATAALHEHITALHERHDEHAESLTALRAAVRQLADARTAKVVPIRTGPKRKPPEKK